MTFFMISGMVAFLAVTGLLWCFQGFTRAIKEGKTVGLLVQPVPDRSVVLRQNVRRIIHTSMQAQRERRRDFSNASSSDTGRLQGLGRALNMGDDRQPCNCFVLLLLRSEQLRSIGPR